MIRIQRTPARGRSSAAASPGARFALALALLVAPLVIAGCGRPSSPTRILEIEMRTSAGTFAQVFWADAPAFTEERSVRLPLKSPGSFQRLYFPLPADGVSWLRFDPMDAPGEALIRHIRLIDAGRQTPGFHQCRTAPASHPDCGDHARRRRRCAFRPRLAAPIPRCISRSVASMADPAGDRFTTVTTAGATLVSLAIVTLLIASVVVIGRAAFAVAPGNDVAAEFTARRGPAALWLAVLFLVVFTAKLHFLHQYPVKVPFWDQWDAEAGAVLIPFNECSLSWRAMFTPHNEHRVFFTRLYALDLVLANGQWDPRAPAGVSTRPCTASPRCSLAMIFWLASNRRHLDLIVFVCALTFALPFAWENTILRDSSHPSISWCSFPILALWLTTSIPARQPRLASWLGMRGVRAVHRCKRRPHSRGHPEYRRAEGRERASRLAGIVGECRSRRANSGLAVQRPRHRRWLQHAPLKAHSVMEFGIALGRTLGWPWIDRPETLGAHVAAARHPAADDGLAPRQDDGTRAVRHRSRSVGRAPRGRRLPMGEAPEALDAGNPLHGFPEPWCRRERDGARRACSTAGRADAIRRRLMWVPLVAWLALAEAGLCASLIGPSSISTLGSRYFAAHVTNVHRLVVTGDVAGFVAKPPLVEVPYPDAQSSRAAPAGPLHPAHPAVFRPGAAADGSPRDHRGCLRARRVLRHPSARPAAAFLGIALPGRQSRQGPLRKPASCLSAAAS